MLVPEKGNTERFRRSTVQGGAPKNDKSALTPGSSVAAVETVRGDIW
jgi:hypothetical protein